MGVSKSTLERAYKPFDLVADKKGNLGFIKEVSVNECQTEPRHQISYAIHWLIGDNNKTAWFNNDELTYHANLFIEIAKAMTDDKEHVQPLFNAMNR